MVFTFAILLAMIDHNITQIKLQSLLILPLFFLFMLTIAGCTTQITATQEVKLANELVTAVSNKQPSATPPIPTSLPALSSITPSATHTNTPIPTATNPPTATPLLPTLTTTNTPSPLPSTSSPLPLPTPAGVYSWTLQVPILMYHYISTPPENANNYRVTLSVPPETFRAQMQYLADNGYTTITLNDLSRAITDKQDLPAKPIILTFDDGYLDNYENAYPILQEFGLTGTFFVPTEFIDFEREGYMSWDAIEEMAAAGNRFEPHGRTHSDMRNRRRSFLVWEILGPIETLEAHVGYRPRFFAYPSGQYDDKTIQMLRELDMWGAVTTQGGTWHGFEERYEWTRVRISNEHTMQDFINRVQLNGTVGGKRIEDE